MTAERNWNSESAVDTSVAVSSTANPRSHSAFTAIIAVKYRPPGRSRCCQVNAARPPAKSVAATVPASRAVISAE